ncbi:AraC family transcriptional regulator [Haematobacter massiliensis]|uniref:AraC family transcriptional regulator n=1 Tax=Haematobacter massiliensis TaxID=195105 RepID=A0A086XX56_9RHOB|nr:helix-turn-helix transcriptional regulator [Haematobacter massiliensis]KFI26606.1 AraC family transcriptional regulator [Haematobacter massiliensis]OWJ73292.1 AraC family transcriptional regulator [Haematobacter massiliensis]OWJ86351.1 AraC family transcriptional regulator [Haematobacter massiliensis]QBJ23902.1 AraC family transcriptional regulator [Haematobacter massiliensis]
MEADPSYREQTAVPQPTLDALDISSAPVIAAAADYPDYQLVPPHKHSRSQLIHALEGVLLVRADAGRWMVPKDHALWLPAETVHSVEMLGNVRMRSAYVLPGAHPALPEAIRVVHVTPLMRELLKAAAALPPLGPLDARDTLVNHLLLHEIPRLSERPLALAFPTDPRLARLCREFIASPDAHVAIDDWAARAGMSRRSFTRHFQQETGLSLSRWRQQASLFAALPRLAAGQPVTTVALDLGYESVAAFTTMFRRMLGSPPRTYGIKV